VSSESLPQALITKAVDSGLRNHHQAIILTKLLAAEVAKNGLKTRINSIAPGGFPGDMRTGGSGSDQVADNGCM
jgi:hypothetical protein